MREELGPSVALTPQQAGGAEVLNVELQDGSVRLGGVRMSVKQDARAELVPQTLFYDMQHQLVLLRNMMQDLVEGEKHLLLIGNQGTGKNKLADHLLSLLNWEREYIQLHRDTTVGSLTVQPTLLEGRVTWEDSPLVRAVRFGRVLVVDEADKAPLEVVVVLKGLTEDGEMSLADGRRILNMTVASQAAARSDGGEVIPIHPDFRMFVLANRPGFPFLGNDFFKECGDVFGMHVVENPD